MLTKVSRTVSGICILVEGGSVDRRDPVSKGTRVYSFVSSDESTELKCAPVPVPGHAHRHVGWTLVSTLDRGRCGSDRADRCGVRAVDHRRVVAGSLTVGTATPRLKSRKAMAACTAWHALGVIVGILVEWDVVARVHIAEDIATFAAVMSAGEVVEAAHTRGFIADGGLGIRLEL